MANVPQLLIYLDQFSSGEIGYDRAKLQQVRNTVTEQQRMIDELAQNLGWRDDCIDCAGAYPQPCNEHSVATRYAFMKAASIALLEVAEPIRTAEPLDSGEFDTAVRRLREVLAG